MAVAAQSAWAGFGEEAKDQGLGALYAVGLIHAENASGLIRDLSTPKTCQKFE